MWSGPIKESFLYEYFELKVNRENNEKLILLDITGYLYLLKVDSNDKNKLMLTFVEIVQYIMKLVDELIITNR